MKPLSARELLEVWEEGLDLPMSDRALCLLGKACSVSNYKELGRLSIGDRDAGLLQLREWMFGTRLMNTANCPVCVTVVEWESGTDTLHLQPPLPEPAVRTFTLKTAAFTVRYRLPDTHDLVNLMAGNTRQPNHRKLLAACILDTSTTDGPCTAAALPDEVWEALAQEMEKEDPQADIRMNISCPVCLHQWEARFDIVSFLWTEIHNRAQRLLQEIHLIARNYGWSEQDILNMNTRRRQLYLKMLST